MPDVAILLCESKYDSTAVVVVVVVAVFACWILRLLASRRMFGDGPMMLMISMIRNKNEKEGATMARCTTRHDQTKTLEIRKVQRTAVYAIPRDDGLVTSHFTMYAYHLSCVLIV